MTSGARRLAGLVSWALVLSGSAALLWRLAGLDQAPFINDEPKFLAAAASQLVTGEVLTRSTVIGTSGYYYGGSIFWFYGLLQWLFGPSALLALGVMAATVTACQAFFVASLARALTPHARWREVLAPEGRWVLGPLLLLLASSPHQHFWARLAWDQLTNAVAFVAVGLVLSVADARLSKAAAIGALLGFGLSSHPMIAPLALLLGLAVFAGAERPFRWKTALGRALALGFAALVVLTPWLRELWAQKGAKGQFGGPTALTLDRALEPFRGPGAWGIEYFFDGEWTTFLGSAHAPLAWTQVAPISRWLLVALGLGGLVFGLFGARRRFALLGLLALVAYPVFFARSGIPVQPHYQFPTGWIVLLGASLLLAAPWAPLRRVAVVLTVGLALWQLHFVGAWRAWIASREGTHGVHYGVTVREQRRVVRELCEQRRPLAVALRITAFTPSFEYLALTEPACEGHPPRWCGMDRACGAVQPGETVAFVDYAEPGAARLAVTFSR